LQLMSLHQSGCAKRALLQAAAVGHEGDEPEADKHHNPCGRRGVVVAASDRLSPKTDDKRGSALKEQFPLRRPFIGTCLRSLAHLGMVGP
jgi:hypothetical protein